MVLEYGVKTNRTIHGNEENITVAETRLHPVFGEEIWLKLERARFSPSVLNGLSVLEVCAGTGFLTFHLLSHAALSRLLSMISVHLK